MTNVFTQLAIQPRLLGYTLVGKGLVGVKRKCVTLASYSPYCHILLSCQYNRRWWAGVGRVVLCLEYLLRSERGCQEQELVENCNRSSCLTSSGVELTRFGVGRESACAWL